MDLATALRYVHAAVDESDWHDLRDPEILVLKGTWSGMTYEQMAQDSEYSTNYLMRDVAPKLWRQLSNVFGRTVGKGSFRAALEAYAEVNPLALSDGGASSVPAESSRAAPVNRDDKVGEIVALPAEPAASSSALGDHAATGSVPLYGYAAELALMKRWLINVSSENSVPLERCHPLLGVWGLHGVGKSLLVRMAVSQESKQFDEVIWRSLQHRPSLDELCSSILTSLKHRTAEDQSEERSPITQLLNLMSQRSLLLVFESIEAILQPNKLAGDYQPTHQEYVGFFQAIANSRSSLIATGTEGPADWIRLDGEYGNRGPQSLYLGGLSESDATVLLQAESLTASKDWPELIARYQGHPLALKSVSRVIREMFNGRVDDFLAHSTGLLTDIRRLIAPSFERLSEAELSVVYWLASQEAPLSLAALQETLPMPLEFAELVSALDSLKQRSLLAVRIQAKLSVFQLPPLIKTFALQQFMGQLSGRPQPAPTGEQLGAIAAESKLDSFIRLKAREPEPIQLNQWLRNNFSADWLPLDYLFEAATPPAVRLRNAYHLRDEAFVKRFKPICFGETAQSGTSSAQTAALIVAIQAERDDSYKICVQAQPHKNVVALPENLLLRLLDAEENLLAEVNAELGDTCIQLPYFLGDSAESFIVELVLNNIRRTETFMI